MNHSDDIITSAKLESILGATPYQESLSTTIKLLLEAINDWPDPINEPKELLFILSQEIGKTLTLENIRHYATTLKVEDSAWKIESISSIIDLFQNDNTKSLHGVLNDIAGQIDQTNFHKPI